MVMASVLTIGTKVRGFKPGRGNVCLRAIKIRSTVSSGGEEKPQVSCDKILRHVNITWKVRTKILRKAKFIISFASPFCLLPDNSAGRIAEELWWMNQEFSSVDIIPPRFSMLI
jgi:hypothetical protein